MKVEVIGKKVGSFTKESGEVVDYGKLHCIAPFDISSSGVVGTQCLILSVRPDVLAGIPAPCTADLQFNQYGRLAGYEVLSVPEVFE